MRKRCIKHSSPHLCTIRNWSDWETFTLVSNHLIGKLGWTLPWRWVIEDLYMSVEDAWMWIFLLKISNKDPLLSDKIASDEWRDLNQPKFEKSRMNSILWNCGQRWAFGILRYLGARCLSCSFESTNFPFHSRPPGNIGWKCHEIVNPVTIAEGFNNGRALRKFRGCSGWVPWIVGNKG